jgi:hypothetical protein
MSLFQPAAQNAVMVAIKKQLVALNELKNSYEQSYRHVKEEIQRAKDNEPLSDHYEAIEKSVDEQFFPLIERTQKNIEELKILLTETEALPQPKK